MQSTVCESYCVASLRGYTRAVVCRSSDELSSQVLMGARNKHCDTGRPESPIWSRSLCASPRFVWKSSPIYVMNLRLENLLNEGY